MGRRRSKQLELELKTWGGRRKGAGRKRKGGRPRVPHASRPELSRHHPVLVTMRIADGLPSLRSEPAWQTILRCFCRAKERFGLRVIDHSVQGNHLHLIVEMEGKESLSRGMRGLNTRLAKQLNKLWKRRGTVFPDRFHARALTTPREVRNAIAYVLRNHAHHELVAARRRHSHALPNLRRVSGVDPRSSGARFDGWRTPIRRTDADLGTVPPRTWLRCVGWKKHGLLALDEIPGGEGPPAA